MVGETFRVSVADGYAAYRVVGVETFGPMEFALVEWEEQAPYDDYKDAILGDSAWVEAANVRGLIERQHRLDALFGGGA